MQHYSDWMPCLAVGPGLLHAKVDAEPGSQGMSFNSVSPEPGWLVQAHAWGELNKTWELYKLHVHAGDK